MGQVNENATITTTQTIAQIQGPIGRHCGTHMTSSLSMHHREPMQRRSQRYLQAATVLRERPHSMLPDRVLSCKAVMTHWMPEMTSMHSTSTTMSLPLPSILLSLLLCETAR